MSTITFHIEDVFGGKLQPSTSTVAPTAESQGRAVDERLWILKRCRLFETLTADQFGLLERHARMRAFPRKHMVYLPSDHADGVYFLAEGRIQLSSYTPDGKQAVLGYIEPGELFGELALVDAGVREEHAEAVVKSTVIWVPTADLQGVMEQSPRLSFGVTRLMGFRRRRIERRLKSLLFRSSRDRLIHLLCELVEQYEQPAQGSSVVLPLSHLDLANLIGSTRETVTMLLGELQLAGILDIGRRRVLLKDPRRLAALAESVGHECFMTPTASNDAERRDFAQIGPTLELPHTPARTPR